MTRKEGKSQGGKRRGVKRSKKLRMRLQERNGRDIGKTKQEEMKTALKRKWRGKSIQ